VFEHEYVQPNIEEVCFSVRPIAKCDEQHVAAYIKHQRVGFHCLNKSSPIAKQYQREADQGRQLPLENKSQDKQAYVEVPVRCESINTEEKRLRKETEKTAEQKIHLVQQQDGEEESFLFEHKPWTSVYEQEDQEHRQHQRHNGRMMEKYQHQEHQMKSQQNGDFSDDEESINEESLDTMQQYGDLISKQTTMHRVLRMNEEQFDRLMEHLKFIAHQNRRSDKWSQQLDQVLPNVFAKVAKQFFETALEKQTSSKQDKEELYEQYKQVVRRIYAYTVKQALQMKHLNQVTGKINGERQEQQQYITNQVARNLWFHVQKELTQQQTEEVRQIAEQAVQNKPRLDRMLADEITSVASNKQKQEQLEKDLTKLLVAGLKMVNHNTAKNQIQSEEYRKYHGEDFEQSFQSQYPKLHQRLNNIQNVDQWRN